MYPTPILNRTGYITPRKSVKKGYQKKEGGIHKEKVIRCLFTPTRPLSLRKHKNDFFTPVRNKFHNSRMIPSFDTPNRSTLTPSDLCKKFSGFTLGRGSFGVVVEGTYKSKRVAVKILKGRSLYRSICREKNAVNLKHPNIIQVFQVIVQPKSSLGFVIMELYGCENLEDILDTFVPIKIKLKYLRKVASALEYCHVKGILHLDVKPKNIIVSTLKNSCKLCDFGSSAHIYETRTVQSPTKGTLKYCAPELLKGCMATEKADVYSFGITMWQLIHEKTPYDNEDLHAIVYKVVTCDYRPDGQLPIGNGTLESIYKSCWQADPKKRPTISKVKAMLKGIQK